MLQNNKPKQNEEQPIFGLLQQIKDGTLDAETLSKELRQSCVEILLGEGSSVVLMAQVLKRSEKTIRRDIEGVRERNAISPNVNLAKKLIGEMLMYARINRDYLMKIARTRDASVSEKAQSEYYAFKVSTELIKSLQTLGYLPTKPQAIVGDIFHHVGEEVVDFDDFARQIIEIEKIADGDAKIEDGVKEDVAKMKTVLEKIKFSENENGKREGPNEDTKE